jgi:hypothetical protein
VSSYYRNFYLTPSAVFQFENSTSPLHMERGEEMFDYRTDEGVRLYLPNRELLESKKKCSKRGVFESKKC